VVPLLKDDALLGAIVAYRQEVRPFTDKQIALLQNFAAQAVIAMENARLITETREALEQQTATAEVLQVINSSPGDLAPVFDAMLEKAVRLCEAAHGHLWRYDGEYFHPATAYGEPQFVQWFEQRGPVRPQPHGDGFLGRIARGEHLLYIADVRETEAYRAGDSQVKALVELSGGRSVITIALRKEDKLVGAMTVYRQEVRPFSDKQIALLQNFAAQAVIAMENARLITETREALDQQTATAEVLGVINSSPGDLAPVFDALLEKALRLCEANFGVMATVESGALVFHAQRNLPAPFLEYLQREPHDITPNNLIGRAMLGRTVVHVADIEAEEPFRLRVPMAVAASELAGIRTMLFVPLVKDDAALGVFTIYRTEVRLFSDKQVALLQNFAAQAVIAMENARLITETREALEQQTATAEVLQVINSSPGDLAPVFEAMLEKALNLCGAVLGYMLTCDGEGFHRVAAKGFSSALEAALPPPGPTPGSLAERFVRGEKIIRAANLREDEAYRLGAPAARALVDVGGVRSYAAVALRNGDRLRGIIAIYRQEVRPFSDKQIALLENFAAQAVIAMENARLITETREALEQQTATAEVLQVINSSPGDLAPVFRSIVEKAHTLCGAACGSLQLWDGEKFRGVAMRGFSEPMVEALRQGYSPGPNHPCRGLINGGRIAVCADMAEVDDPVTRLGAKLSGIRTVAYLALRKDDLLLGQIVAGRLEVRPFTDAELALLENFAAQAVIAMENARLITETREALEQQTATSEVLQVINSSPGDLAPVFDAILEKAHTLCGAAHGSLQLYDGENLHAVATHAVSDKFAEVLRQGYRAADSPASQALIEGDSVIQIADCAEIDHPVFRSAAELAGIRTVLFVPLRRDAAFLGLISAARLEVRPFTEKQIALLQNFAAQAVIAMENARLINETREALEQQTATAEVLQVINSSPGDLAPVFDAILEKAHALCGAVFGGLLAYDGDQFRAVALRGVPEAFREFMRQPFRPAAGNPLTRLVRGEALLHIPDLRAVAPPDDPVGQAGTQLGGIRTLLVVPLRKDDTLLGVITSYRQEVRPFSDKQIALLQNFAAQAVIAMENARLITETREALDQQTATAEVLQVINSSPGHLAPVFDAMLEKAVRLCDGAQGTLWMFDGDCQYAAATAGVPAELAAQLRKPRNILGYQQRLRDGERVFQIADLAASEAYRAGNPLTKLAVEAGVVRTAAFVALVKDTITLGGFTVSRREVRPFTDKQIALLQNFAAQAVIAMENARLITETREALEQQTATAEVLQVINSSPGDLAPVFDAILEKAHTLCEAAHGALMIYDRGHFCAVATHGMSETFAELLRQPFRASTNSAQDRLLHGERLIQIPDVAGHVRPASDARIGRASVEAGVRTLLMVPLRKDGALLGYITAYRREVRPFSDKQIALLENFAAQAVIAMENARLITETREALEQQTATAEVLGVINSSPGDLAPVFDAMLDKARRLCDAALGSFWSFDGQAFQVVASTVGGDVGRTVHPGPGVSLDRIARGESVVQIADVTSEEAYRTDAVGQARTRLAGTRTAMAVALRKDGTLLGAITAGRQEVRPFSDKQIALLQNFAAQAVIAMENARLIAETREALEQQTATAEVLQVINSSPGDLAPVFDAMLDKAIRLCGGAFGTLMTYDGARFHTAAMRGLPPPLAEFMREPQEAGPGTVLARVVSERSVVRIDDIAANEAYRRRFPRAVAQVELGGARTMIGIPLVKDDALLGVFHLYRQEVRPFSDKELALLQSFAAQAVIAMENVRLITELRESLEYQTATSDVLKVVSRSTFDLQTVLQAVVATAIRLCRADSAVIYRNDGGEYRWAAGHMLSPEYEQIERNVRILPGTGTVVGRAALEGATVQILDTWTDPLYEAKDDARVGNVHTMIGVPLLREGAPIGVIGLARRRVEAFSEREIQLVTTFADQAVIAIENVRLLNDLQGRTRDLQESLEYQTATSDVLKVISQSGGELDPVLQTLVETAARICEADKAVLFQLRDGVFRMGASIGFTQEFKDYRARNPIAPGRGTPIGRVALERRVLHIEDALNDPEFADAEAQRLGQLRTMLAVPLFREDAIIGSFFLARSRVEPFGEKEIALVATFADQAVIAIENARLFNELRARTAELGRSVEELQTLSEVGQAVSSTLDLRAVLSTILTRSVALTGADAGAIYRYSRSERAFRQVEAVGYDEALMREVRDMRVAEAESAMGEAVARRVPIQLANLAERPSFALRDVMFAAGFRSVLVVPLIGPGRVLGAILLQRRIAGEFPPETVQLMQTLASQSVLAIQNARLFREIADKSEQLALASEHKSQFLANMSHELRTPLNAILGYAELLVDGIYGQLPERPSGVLERIQNNGRHLLALINDVLDLAKIEAGQLTLTLEDYSLPEVVRSVVTATEPLASGKGLKFTSSLQADVPRGHGDARRLSQVLLNLVGNAIKFTDTGEVEIRGSADRGQFVIEVRDTGPGIADADQDRIFGEFQQIDNSNTRQKGGTGLGLAISKRMVEMQGGTISVESALGQGSTFRVVLPVHVDEMMEAAE
jgi:GAF domain-containing protein